MSNTVLFSLQATSIGAARTTTTTAARSRSPWATSMGRNATGMPTVRPYHIAKKSPVSFRIRMFIRVIAKHKPKHMKRKQELILPNFHFSGFPIFDVKLESL